MPLTGSLAVLQKFYFGTHNFNRATSNIMLYPNQRQNRKHVLRFSRSRQLKNRHGFCTSCSMDCPPLILFIYCNSGFRQQCLRLKITMYSRYKNGHALNMFLEFQTKLHLTVTTSQKFMFYATDHKISHYFTVAVQKMQ